MKLITGFLFTSILFTSACTKSINTAEKDVEKNVTSALRTPTTTTTSILQWQKCLGSNNNEESRAMVKSSKGGYIIGANSLGNYNGDVQSPNRGGYDAWIVKIDDNGLIEWQKTFGGPGYNWVVDIVEVTDGYVFCGSTYDNPADLQGDGNAWIVKVDFFGNLMWEKSLGTAGTSDLFHSLSEETTTGDLYVTGQSKLRPYQSTNLPLKGLTDISITKLNNSGDVIWSKFYGGSLEDYPGSVIVDNGVCIVAATSASADGDLSGTTKRGGQDAWLFNIDPSTGDLITGSHKVYGGTADESGVRLIKNVNGGFIMSSSTLSNNGDVAGNHGGRDGWIVKLNTDLIIESKKCYGGSGEDNFRVYCVNANEILLSGNTDSKNGDLSINKGSADLWLVRVGNNASLDKLNSNSLGGSGLETGWGAAQATDGSYMVVGRTTSTKGDVSGNLGGIDVWLLKAKF